MFNSTKTEICKNTDTEICYFPSIIKTTHISLRDHVKCVFMYMEWFLKLLKIESKVNLIF